jgi:predicted N-acetyltransferase YhbS
MMQFELSHASDQPAIDALLDQAFGLSRRIKASYRLREGSQEVGELGWVLRDPELGVVATISYWPLVIGATRQPALLLGPLAVHPARQGLGIGLALMRDTLAKAKAHTRGYACVLLVGDEPYYARVGFKRVPPGQLDLPGPFNPQRFLYLELQDNALENCHGLVKAAHRR